MVGINHTKINKQTNKPKSACLDNRKEKQNRNSEELQERTWRSFKSKNFSGKALHTGTCIDGKEQSKKLQFPEGNFLKTQYCACAGNASFTRTSRGQFSRARVLRAAGFRPRYYTDTELVASPPVPPVAMVSFSLLRTTRVRTGFCLLDDQWKGPPKVGFSWLLAARVLGPRGTDA